MCDLPTCLQDVLISGTYVKPLFVMQLWGREHAKCCCRILYKNKEQRWRWVIIPCCLEGPFTHQGPCMCSQSRSEELWHFLNWPGTFCLLCCFSLVAEMTRTPSWPASGNDRRTSCLKCCSPRRLMSPACPALISIWPSESWTGATAGKLKMHHVIHLLNDCHHIRDLTTRDKSSQRTLMAVLSGSGVGQWCWDFVMICSTSTKMYYCQTRRVRFRYDHYWP